MVLRTFWVVRSAALGPCDRATMTALLFSMPAPCRVPAALRTESYAMVPRGVPPSAP